MDDIPRLAAAFGLALRSAREEAGMTQEHLAGQAGCATSYVRFLEHGRRMPTLNALLHLARALDADPRALLDRCLRMRERLAAGGDS